MGRKKRKPKPKQPPRKKEKLKQKRPKPITRKPRKKRAPILRASLWQESISSPGALEMEEILEREGGLFVPVGPENNEGASAAASSQSRQRSNVHQHLKNLEKKHGRWAAAEWAMTWRQRRKNEKAKMPRPPSAPMERCGPILLARTPPGEMR